MGNSKAISILLLIWLSVFAMGTWSNAGQIEYEIEIEGSINIFETVTTYSGDVINVSLTCEVKCKATDTRYGMGRQTCEVGMCY